MSVFEIVDFDGSRLAKFVGLSQQHAYQIIPNTATIFLIMGI